MADRVRSDEVAFLTAEKATNPTHVSTLEIFEPASAGFDYGHLVGLIHDRLGLVPRYRQRLAGMPGGVLAPQWVDDEDFDITFHVRRSALPQPGNDQQLAEFVSRVMSRRLDRTRPLWEMYLIEGLEGGRFAILTKCHLVLVDGLKHLGIAQVYLDNTSDSLEVGETWQPSRTPSMLSRLAGAGLDALKGPGEAVDLARGSLASVTGSNRVRETAQGLLNRAVTQRRNAESPLHIRASMQRRVELIRTDLEPFRSIRAAHGGTVNDAFLTVLTGAFRSWLISRGERVDAEVMLNAVVPMSIRSDRGGAESGGAVGGRVITQRVALPVGETSPVMRLHQIAYQTKAHSDTGRAVGARSLAQIAGFAPGTLHVLAARSAASALRPSDDLVIANVPGPQSTLYASGAAMQATYPILPVLHGRALSVGLTSYDGHVFFGFTADRDAVADLNEVSSGLQDSIAELAAIGA